MRRPRRKGSLHLPARIYLSPINVCATATAWPSAELRLIPVLMHLLCLHWPPLATRQLLFVFVAIGLLSTSIHLCLLGCDISLKWLIKRQVSTPKATPRVPCLNALPIVLRRCLVKYWICEVSKKSCSFSWSMSQGTQAECLIALMQFRKLKAIQTNIVFHTILKPLSSICPT